MKQQTDKPSISSLPAVRLENEIVRAYKCGLLVMERQGLQLLVAQCQDGQIHGGAPADQAAAGKCDRPPLQYGGCRLQSCWHVIKYLYV